MTKPIQIKNLTIGAGIPKICVPLTGTTREKICQEAEDAKKAAADLVEWRADFFEELMNPEACQNVLEALAEILGETPLLFTIRTSEEGGNITISLEDYAACNINIAKGKKADLVDVEVMSNSEEKKKLVAELQKEGVKVIASSHDFHNGDKIGAVHLVITDNFFHYGAYVFCGASEARCMVCSLKVIINGFRHTDKPYIRPDFSAVFAHLAERVHRIVAADIEEVLYIKLF